MPPLGGGIFRHNGCVNSIVVMELWGVNSKAAMELWGVVEGGMKLQSGKERDASRWCDGRWSEVRTRVIPQKIGA